jgi:hypothetical protein
MEYVKQIASEPPAVSGDLLEKRGHRAQRSGKLFTLTRGLVTSSGFGGFRRVWFGVR